MAAVVNTRDLIIQATLPRVATVTMAPNIVVSPDQVDGLGLIIDGTKQITLSSTTQVFQVAKDGTVSPTSAVFAAKLQNISTTPGLTVTAGTISPPPVLQPDMTFTVLESQLVTDSATIHISVTENGITYFDDVSIARVREGADAITALLTNETCSLPSDHLGNVVNYGGASGNFKVYLGMTDVTNLCQFAIDTGGNPQNLTVSINPATGAYIVTGGYPVDQTQATVMFKATFGTNVLKKQFTLTKAISGTQGQDGQRGSMTFYVPLSGSTAVWSDSLATTVVTAQGGPILNDTVTQYNNSMNFSKTKFWQVVSGVGSWADVNAVVDGNLLVSGTVASQHLQGTTLGALKASLGTVTIDSNGWLKTNGVTDYNTGSGVFVGWDTNGTSAYKFRVGGAPGGNGIFYNGSTLVVQTPKLSFDSAGNATFSGALSAASGTFNGNISGASGTFQGSLYAAGGLFQVNGASGAVTIASGFGGARQVISNATTLVYDGNGTLRVRMGVW